MAVWSGNPAVENAFEPYHTAVPAVFFGCALVFTMMSMNPVCVGVAFSGALTCSLLMCGAEATLAMLRWLVPFWLVVAIINSGYSSSQAASIVQMGMLRLGFESFCFGLTAGAMISAVVLWFAAAGACISSDSALGFMAGAIPTVSLMISQVMRLVPQMLRRGGEVLAVQSACCNGEVSWREALHDRIRVVSVLVGWSMEDGAVRAESMRARAYGCPARRTRYRTRRLRMSDVMLSLVIGAVGIAACEAAGFVGSQFQFYPLIDAQGSCWAAIPGLVLVLAPVLLTARSAMLWR